MESDTVDTLVDPFLFHHHVPKAVQTCSIFLFKKNSGKKEPGLFYVSKEKKQ